MNSTENLHCNFISPPDYAPEDLPSVLIIDPTWDELEELVLWYKNCNCQKSYNVYFYKDTLWDNDWLANVAAQVNTIIVNTDESAITNIKMKYIDNLSTYYYGPIKFKGSDRQVDSPLDWFVKHGG